MQSTRYRSGMKKLSIINFILAALMITLGGVIVFLTHHHDSQQGAKSGIPIVVRSLKNKAVNGHLTDWSGPIPVAGPVQIKYQFHDADSLMISCCYDYSGLWAGLLALLSASVGLVITRKSIGVKALRCGLILFFVCSMLALAAAVVTAIFSFNWAYQIADYQPQNILRGLALMNSVKYSEITLALLAIAFIIISGLTSAFVCCNWCSMCCPTGDGSVGYIKRGDTVYQFPNTQPVVVIPYNGANGSIPAQQASPTNTEAESLPPTYSDCGAEKA